jgi:hypothetical protein
MDDADAFSSLYEQEGEAVLMFLARRTMDVEVAVDLTAETSRPAPISCSAVEQRRLAYERAHPGLLPPN